MAIIGGRLANLILRIIAPRINFISDFFNSQATRCDLKNLFGDEFEKEIRDKTVIDFGCGRGSDTVQMALMGARKVVGLDIQKRFLSLGKQLAIQFSVSDRCSFVFDTNVVADIVISKNAFEHFSDPVAILDQMSKLVRAQGFAWIVFGPTWFHPYGGHLFSVFPFAHLIFSEISLISWRSRFVKDGATRFEEVEGGLNRMTIKRFEEIVDNSPFRFVSFETIPIKNLKFLKYRILREIGTSIIRCKLKLR